MTQGSAVRIGRIATGRRARIHLAIDGHTGCGARNRAHIAYPATTFPLAVSNLCRRCFTPTRVGAAQSTLVTATGPDAARNRTVLDGVAQTMKTPQQRAADAELAARIRATMAAAGSIMPLPPVERPRSWAALRDDYATTHYQPAA